MVIWKAVAALILTPFTALGILIILAIIIHMWDKYCEDILGVGFLLSWLLLIFSIVYKLL
jgi:hypothetical protein